MATSTRLLDYRMPAVPQKRLRRVQRWLQACITAPGSVDEALRSASASKEFEPESARQLIRPSWSLRSLERLAIYRDMYEARLLGALRVDYPALERFLGEDQFRELASLYVHRYPSQSYTLNRLGDRLPRFIDEVHGLPRPRLVKDLAVLELARTEVFDERESPRVSSEEISAIGEASWSTLRLKPIAALRALQLSHPVHDYVEALHQKSTPPRIRPKRTFLLVYRRDFAVMHLVLSAPAFALFNALLQDQTLEEAMEQMFAEGGMDETGIFQCFQSWFSEQLFADVRDG